MKLHLPSELTWLNTPADFQASAEDCLTIGAGADSDWFSDPSGNANQSNAPVALFDPPDSEFMLSARVKVDFNSLLRRGSGGFSERRIGGWAERTEFMPNKA